MHEESRVRQIILGRDGLHHVLGQPALQRTHRRRIAPEYPRAKRIDLIDGEFHHADHSLLGWYGNSGGLLDATENYWSTTDETVIESMILDVNDDLGLNRAIPYSPVLTAPHADTPDPTPWL